LGGELPLAVGLNRLPQLHFGYVPFQNAARSFLNGKPAHVPAASIAAPVTLEREDIIAFGAVGRTDSVAQRDYRHREMLYRRDASFDPFAGRLCGPHWSGIERGRRWKEPGRKEQGDNVRQCGCGSCHPQTVASPFMSAMGWKAGVAETSVA
jgi:hypothetical protein